MDYYLKVDELYEQAGLIPISLNTFNELVKRTDWKARVYNIDKPHFVCMEKE